MYLMSHGADGDHDLYWFGKNPTPEAVIDVLNHYNLPTPNDVIEEFLANPAAARPDLKTVNGQSYTWPATLTTANPDKPTIEAGNHYETSDFRYVAALAERRPPQPRQAATQTSRQTAGSTNGSCVARSIAPDLSKGSSRAARRGRSQSATSCGAAIRQIGRRPRFLAGVEPV